jgi:hypothetical protein
MYRIYSITERNLSCLSGAYSQCKCFIPFAAKFFSVFLHIVANVSPLTVRFSSSLCHPWVLFQFYREITLLHDAPLVYKCFHLLEIYTIHPFKHVYKRWQDNTLCPTQ